MVQAVFTCDLPTIIQSLKLFLTTLQTKGLCKHFHLRKGPLQLFWPLLCSWYAALATPAGACHDRLDDLCLLESKLRTWTNLHHTMSDRLFSSVIMFMNILQTAISSLQKQVVGEKLLRPSHYINFYKYAHGKTKILVKTKLGLSS